MLVGYSVCKNRTSEWINLIWKSRCIYVLGGGREVDGQAPGYLPRGSLRETVGKTVCFALIYQWLLLAIYFLPFKECFEYLDIFE